MPARPRWWRRLSSEQRTSPASSRCSGVHSAPGASDAPLSVLTDAVGAETDRVAELLRLDLHDAIVADGGHRPVLSIPCEACVGSDR